MDGVGRIDADAGDEAAPTGGRTRKRDSLFLSARMRVGSEEAEHEVRVRNLSETGLMIELDRMIDPGQPIELEMRGVGTIAGRIAWCTHGRLGIALDHPIDPGRARKPVGAGAHTPGYAKMIVTGRR